MSRKTLMKLFGILLFIVSISIFIFDFNIAIHMIELLTAMRIWLLIGLAFLLILTGTYGLFLASFGIILIFGEDSI